MWVQLTELNTLQEVLVNFNEVAFMKELGENAFIAFSGMGTNICTLESVQEIKYLLRNEKLKRDPQPVPVSRLKD